MNAHNNKNARLTASDRLFHTINNLFWVLILIIVLYPLYLVVIASFSDPDAILRGQVFLWPVGFSTIGYESVLRYDTLMRSYLNSIIYTVSGTAISIMATLLAAYSLSRPRFPGKKVISFLFIFTMFFGGGLIPTFLVMRDIGLYNNPLVLVLMGCVTVWNLMVARTYIQTTIPTELYEAATLDGASHFQYFFRVVLPLSGTIIAVLCIYYGISKWNDYFSGLVYIRDRQYLPLQTVLREILATLKVDVTGDYMMSLTDSGAALSEALRVANVAKYCIIVISTGPVILLYLFMQKYFVKGVMIGSLKG